MGDPLCVHAAVDRHLSAGCAAFLASPFRQGGGVLGLAFLIPCALVYGFPLAFAQLVHVFLGEYVPFIILLFALFTVAGGVRLKGQLVGTPAVNTGILLIGTVLASWMGTTGAAMLLIRPLLRANAHRKFRMHSVVFFIFLVANIGGSLTRSVIRRFSSVF